MLGRKRYPPVGRIAVSILFLLMAGSAVVAQLPTAAILGVVRDASGAAVPDAKLTARNVETGQTRTTVSADDGSYRFSALPVGNYEVRAEHSGFQSAERSGLKLAVSQEAVVNISLQVGSVDQTVAVTAEAPQVNTTSDELGGLVNEEKVTDLPLNGRNYVDLTLMQTGVSQQIAVNKQTSTGIYYAGTYFSSNGAPVRSNSYLLDGANLTNVWGASSASADNSTLGIDGIREFKVVTNYSSAEYGLTMGSQMTMVSKGGTNNFHGDVFEYLRNSAMDARNPYDLGYLQGGPRLPQLIRNNFGASGGGPIKKDKTFFYGVFEGLRQRLGVTTITSTIGAGCHGIAGATITVAACPQLAPTSSVVISPLIAPFLAQYPIPQFGNNVTFPFSEPTSDNYGQIRVDQNFSGKDSMFGRYTIEDSAQTIPYSYPQFATTAANRNQFLTLSENHIFSPTILNTARFSFSRTNLYWVWHDAPSVTDNPALIMIPGYPMGSVAPGSGITAMASPGRRLQKQNIFSWSDDLFYTRGHHSLKFGTLINHYQQEIINGGGCCGTIAFGNLANYLQVLSPTTIGINAGPNFERTYHMSSLGFYAQDDWRVTGRLTLNLGLRYEFATTPVEANGEYSVLTNVQTSTSYTTSAKIFNNSSLKDFSPRFGFAWSATADGKTAVRGGFGLLYDLIVGPQVGVFTLQSQLATPPFSQRYNAVNPPASSITFPINVSIFSAAAALAPRPIDYNIRQPHMLTYNLTLERQLPFDMTLTLAYVGSRGIDLTQTREGNPTVPNGIQVNGACAALPTGQAFNISVPYCWLPGATRVNPNFGTMDLFTADANSWYNALQFGLVKRLAKGLQLQSSYTWSRVIDQNNGSTFVENDNISATEPVNPWSQKADQGPAAFDLTQVWKFNAIYQFPKLVSSEGAAAKLLNGWWTSGILSFQSGPVFTPALTANRSHDGVNGGAANLDRPDRVPGRSIYSMTHGVSTANGIDPCPTAGQPLGTATLYFDPCAFTIPASGFLGASGRNILRGPGLANLDFSLVKDTALRLLGESGKIQFRAEIFNITNHPNRGLPGRTVYNATANVESPLASAGQILYALTTSRQIQLALKILF